MNRFTKIDKLIILILGVVLGTLGVYGTYLELAGRYMEMGLLFFLWILLQFPVYFVADLFGHSRNAFYVATFIWWFLIGSTLAFTFFFLLNNFICLNSEEREKVSELS